MKKAHFKTILLLLGLLNLQTLWAQKVAIGVTGGGSLNSMFKSSDKCGACNKWKPIQKLSAGFSVTLPVEFKLTEIFSIQTGLAFNQRGYNNRWSDNTGHELKLYYLELPILAKLHLGKNKRFFIQMGQYLGCGLLGRSVHKFQLGYFEDQINSNLIFDTTVPDGEQFESPIISKIRFRDFDKGGLNAGIIGGWGFSIPLRKGAFIVDNRISFSFTGASRSSLGNSEHIGLSSNFGYLFYIGGNK